MCVCVCVCCGGVCGGGRGRALLILIFDSNHLLLVHRHVYFHYFSRGDNFCNFLSVILDDVTVPKWNCQRKEIGKANHFL